MMLFYRIYRRLVLAGMMVSMLSGAAWLGGVQGITAYGSTLPPATTLPSDQLEDEAGDTMGYKWVPGTDRDGWGGESFRVNLRGFKGGETDYEDGTMSLTHQDSGLPTYLFMAGEGRETAPKGAEIPNLPEYDPSVRQDANYYMAKLGQRDSAGNKITDYSEDNPKAYNGMVEKLTFGTGSEAVDVEIRITTTLSPDGKYVVVDYYICHIGGNIPAGGRRFWLGSSADVEVNQSQADTVYMTDKGFEAWNAETHSVMNIVTPYRDLLHGSEPAPDTKWIGPSQERVPALLTDSTSISEINGDYSLAYSWELRLRPYETIHKKVAFHASEASYYVSSANGVDAPLDQGGSVGTADAPFATLDYALLQCGEKNAVIGILDYDPISSPIDMVPESIASEKTKVVITGTADMVFDRKYDYRGTMFNQTRQATIILDGIGIGGLSSECAEPIFNVSDGTLEIRRRVSLGNENCKGFSITGKGNLRIDASSGETIYILNWDSQQRENPSIYFNSTGTFTIVTGPDLQMYKGDGIVHLADGKHILLEGSQVLSYQSIGLTIDKYPAVSSGGVITQPDQEIVVAVATDRYTGSKKNIDAAFFENSDARSFGCYTSLGTEGFGGANNVVMRREGHTMSFTSTDPNDANNVIPEAPVIPDCYFGTAEAVTIPAPSAIAGYELIGIDIEPNTISSLTPNLTVGSDDFGTITGTMPDQSVVVNYQYGKQYSTIIFQANGGTPEPEPLTGRGGSTVPALLPDIRRYGYIFKGWSKTPEGASQDDMILALDKFPDEDTTYYAIFQPNPLMRFDYIVEHTNGDGTITFQPTPETAGHTVETEINGQSKEIHGYQWSGDDSGTTPAGVGTFDNDTGVFSGHMPSQDTMVHYRYQVDYSSEDARSPLIVKHETKGGTTISPQQTSHHYPEDPITTQPANRYGYECVNVRIDAGDKISAAGDPVSLLEKAPSPAGVFQSRMPNQPVTITYLYEPTGEGYPLTVQYIDNGTQDEQLRGIIVPEPHIHQAEDPVGTACLREPVFYRCPYGYTLEDKSMDQAAGSITWIGDDFTGAMPNDFVTVTYRHNRIPSKWTLITYQVDPNAKGQLSGEGISPDVLTQTNGTYQAGILFSDGTDPGRSQAYTLEIVREKHLMPQTMADQYYRFGGWFVDTNSDKILNNGETLLADDYQFTGPMTLTAHFEKDPAWWLDVHFTAGEHGTMNVGETVSKDFTIDQTWGDIQNELPEYEPEVNYLKDGWFAGDTRMEDTMALVNGQTYTICFTPDPEIFGTDVRAPEAVPGINSQGAGRITVYHTAVGYHYLLTDADGTILEIIPGNAMTERAVYDGLSPGTRYRVYEVDAELKKEEGGHIDSITQTVSVPARVVIPVVETNYQVYYDEDNEGKTRLTISPADPASDYALIDSQGQVVSARKTQADGWQTPTGSPASVSYSGLDYNQQYTIVARPKGQTDITAASRQEDGTVITTDPGGKLELPNYILETIGGEIRQVGETTVEETHYEDAHKGDRIALTAEASNHVGQAFSHWKFLIGSVDGLGNEPSQRNLSFTMPDTNLVLEAVYDRATASPANARMEDEVRGGSHSEVALDPRDISGLEVLLTTEADRELISINRADVTYKAVYRKNYVKAEEVEAVKSSDHYDSTHEEALKTVWGLDVSLERYVNGRKIDIATPSDAEFNTYIQLGKDDVDMMDYQLYELTEDPGGTIQAVEIPITWAPDSGSPDFSGRNVHEEGIVEKTGGLFTFPAKAGSRYVMIYSRAYRLYFLNNTAPEGDSGSYRYRYQFKVRREDTPKDDCYTEAYQGVAEQLDYFINTDGAEYRYLDWSYLEDKLRRFDPDRKITRKTYVYAYYEHNKKDVSDARDELEAAIEEAIKLRDDHFMKQDESQNVKEIIDDILEVLDKENPQATVKELNDALNTLKEQTAPYEEELEDRYDHYEDLQDGGNKGGGGGGGGGGRGTKQDPYRPKSLNTYEIGTNGSWVEVGTQSGEKQWSFVLNGGKPLSSMWARLKHGEEDAKADGWYHFNSSGVMETGWFRDEQGGWYYCYRKNEGSEGKMAAGWHKDNQDGRWYHLDPLSGAMTVGWRQINDKWYYFERVGGNSRPLGSMYQNELTPDGYTVDGEGAWIQ